VVNEGSAGSVSFANASGGSGGYLYSYDFNNDGTFEVSGSANATASVPAAFLADGPAARTVRGRISDSAGAFRDYTASISISNVAPAVTLANRSGTTGNALVFSAGVTDPSSADTAAGFSYAWNFGDGATSIQTNPSHSYANPGSYTVSVTVTDKNGGATARTATATITAPAPVGEVIDTGHDKIPNFGANANIVTVASGNWSSPSTWSLGRVPTAGDIVAIKTGFTVTYDLVSDAAVKTVAIQGGGRLIFRTDVNTRLTVVNFLVLEGGELRIGSAAAPVAANVKAEVIFADVPLDTTNDPAQYGNGLIALGKVTMHGAPLSDTFVRLAIEPRAGDTTLILSEPVTGWQAGDRLLLPDSHQVSWLDPGWGRTERPTIASVSADGLVVTLTAPLAHAHPGARDAAGNLDFTPHVGNLTRTIVVRSASATGTRGHTMFTHRADVDIRFVSFAGLGRTKIDELNNTLYDSNGGVTRIGTNQQGRYPVHMHHLMGPINTPANGYQYTFVGNSITCPLDPMPFRWGLTLHNSHYGLIQDNVLYNWAGASIVAEDGSESFNVVEHNFVVRTTGNGDRGDARIHLNDLGIEGTGIWFRGSNNYVRNNVAAVSAVYGYNIMADRLGTIRFPAFKGADTSIDGQYVTAQGISTPLLQFEGNEAYGSTWAGLTIWNIGSGYTGTAHNIGQSVVKDFHVWNHHAHGFYGYPINNFVFDGLVVRGNPAAVDNATFQITGMYFGDYLTANTVIRNADIQGMQVGIHAPMKVGSVSDIGNTPQAFVIENSHLWNYVNVRIDTMWGVTGGGADLAARDVIIRNVRFDQLALPDRSAWDRKYDIRLIYLDSSGGEPGINYIQRDRVFVYDYDQVAGDNFRVYNHAQRADFVMLQSGPNGRVGSTVAGLTNQQNWDLYGIAIGGEIAPADALTRALIYGLVKPL
jgi:PKD repeat protein